MKLVVPDSVGSIQDLSGLTLEVHNYLEWQRHETIKHRIAGSRKSRTKIDTPVLSPAAGQLIAEWRNEGLESLEKALNDYAKTAQTITITLAAAPSSSIRDKLVGWCRTNLEGSILVDWRYNRTMLGGLTVRVGSHIYDWSFRSQMPALSQHLAEAIGRV